MRASANLEGAKFGRLSVIRRNGKGPLGVSLWLCLCDCGKEVTTRASALLRKLPTRSCGCLRTEKAVARGVERFTKHGCKRRTSVTPEYQSWLSMRHRCNDKHNASFKYYGGRGISVCKRWDDFAAFLEDMGPRGKDLTLDRIDCNGNYEPSNCRWATSAVQASNKRNSKARQH